MIYPTSRSVSVMAAGAPAALAIGLTQPGYWVAGAAWVVLIGALCLADALLGAPRDAVTLALDAPGSLPTAGSATMGLRVSFERRPPPVAEAAAQVNARLSLGAPRTTAQVRGGEANATFELSPVRRGEGEIEKIWARWRGPFGLVWKQVTQTPRRIIPITPNVGAVKDEAIRLFARDAAFGLKAQLETGEGSEFHALRELAPGMDKRAIDWKQSARHGKLLAKEFRTERNHPVIFAIDTGRLMCEPLLGTPRLDRAINAALLMAFVSLKMGDRVGFFGFDVQPRLFSGAVSGAHAFPLLQRAAARLDYSTEETNYTLGLTQLGAALERRALIVVFTDFADTTSAELMLENVGRLIRRHLVLFVIFRDEELEAIERREPVDPEAVSRAVTAGALLRERDLVIARLARLGAHIVDAPAASIGTALLSAYIDLKRRDLM
ncbi:MAG TPA: DUF58 domain-containing protein [Caulobacteraceae bacterium]|nr:DUF58 domain-containing protein [Caulobacteraceae bacterium]